MLNHCHRIDWILCFDQIFTYCGKLKELHVRDCKITNRNFPSQPDLKTTTNKKKIELDLLNFSGSRLSNEVVDKLFNSFSIARYSGEKAFGFSQISVTAPHPNLEMITLEKNNGLEKVFINNPEIKFLSLRSCLKLKELTLKTPNLKYLSLSKCYEISRLDIQSCTNLKTLILPNLYLIKNFLQKVLMSEIFPKISANLKNFCLDDIPLQQVDVGKIIEVLPKGCDFYLNKEKKKKLK